MFVDLNFIQLLMQKLSPPEEQAMKVIWQLGETHIRAILDELTEDQVPYTTLASTIKNRAETVTARYKGRFAEYDLNNEMAGGNVE